MTDPPWLEEACAVAFAAFKQDAPDLYPGPEDWVHNVVRAVLAFAARQPRPESVGGVSPPADPPWLDEAADLASNVYFGWGPSGHCEGWDAVVRAVLDFAARQPRGITEAEVEAAHSVLIKERLPVLWSTARAALEAAEKARRCR